MTSDLKRARIGFFVIAAILAASPAVFAQSISPLDPPDTERYLKWGPFRVRPGLTIPNLGYDSNVFYRPDGSDLPQVGDYFIALAPRIEGVVLFGHRAFFTFDHPIALAQHRLDMIAFDVAQGTTRRHRNWLCYGGRMGRFACDLWCVAE